MSKSRKLAIQSMPAVADIEELLDDAPPEVEPDLEEKVLATDLVDRTVVPFPAGGTGRLRATTTLPETLDTVLGLDQPVSVFDDAERLVGCITPRSLLLKIASTRHAS